MGKAGYAINAIAIIAIIFFNVVFCFPAGLPVAVDTMNYNSVILVGTVFITTVWWFVGARHYEGPKVAALDEVVEQGRRLSTV
jgi:choline transport protein